MTQPSGNAESPSNDRAAGSTAGNTGPTKSGADVSAGDSRLMNGLRAIVPYALLMTLALLTGMICWSATGANWPDAPRYANAAAMIRDWLVSDGWPNPIAFAQENYATYPAFNVPFHPPGYPGMLALWFLAAGPTYFAARLFVAIFSGVSLCAFYAILRRGLASRAACFVCALLLLTTPAYVRWTRCTMSEIPSLAFILLATICFLKWVDEGRPAFCWLAFALAEIAFMCRYTTAALLPGWILYAWLMGRPRRVFSWHVVVPVLIYFMINVPYLRFAKQYAQFEFAADGKASWISWDNLKCWRALWGLWYWGTTLVGLVGLAVAWRLGRRFPLSFFWLVTFVVYMIYKLVVPSLDEIRHFFGAIVALVGLTTVLFSPGIPHWARRLGPALMLIGIFLNVSFALHPWHYGLVGYDRVATSLAALPLERNENLLLNCIDEQDLIFRYRGQVPTTDHRMLRGDRTLALRGPNYAELPAQVFAKNAEDVLETIRKGRARYVVTCDFESGLADNRPPEMQLAHDVVSADGEHFKLISQHPLFVQYSGPGLHFQVYVWEYLGELPDGPSELKVLIPTSGMSL